MRGGSDGVTMRVVVRYRIVVDGKVSSRLVSGLEGVELEPHGEGTVLLVEAETATELDLLLERLGDLGLKVVSLDQRHERT